jgi:hypothetical protein
MNDVVFPSELLPLHFLLHFLSSLAIYVHLCRLNITTICNFRLNTKELRILPANRVCVWYDSLNKQHVFSDKALTA